MSQPFYLGCIQTAMKRRWINHFESLNYYSREMEDRSRRGIIPRVKSKRWDIPSSCQPFALEERSDQEKKQSSHSLVEMLDGSTSGVGAWIPFLSFEDEWIGIGVSNFHPAWGWKEFEENTDFLGWSPARESFSAGQLSRWGSSDLIRPLLSWKGCFGSSWLQKEKWVFFF